MKKFTNYLMALVLAMVATAAFAQEEQMVIKLGSAVTELEVGKQYVMQSVLTGYYIYPKDGATEGANLWSSDFALKGMTEEEAQDFFITLEAVDADNLVFNIKYVTSGLYLNLGEPDSYSTLTAEASQVKLFPIDGTDNTFSMSESESSINYFFTEEGQQTPCQTIQLSMTGEEITLPGYQYRFYLVEYIPESELGPFPYEFVNTQWGSSDGSRLDKENITYNDDNTITVIATESGQDEDGNPAYNNNAALGNSLDFGGTIATEDFYTRLDQQWLVVVGTDLSTVAADSYLWWLNGANAGSSVPCNYAVTLSDGRVLIAWDVTHTGIDANLRDETNLQNGWTCFGVTPLSEDGKTTFSDIAFYSWEEAVAKYPDLADIDITEDETVPYEFVNTQWITSDFGRLLEDNVTYNDDNTITAKATVAGYDDDGAPIYTNNIGLGNSEGRAAFDGITTSGFYTTAEQNWLVVVGTDLSLVATDSYLWWLNGTNKGTQVAATYSITLEDGRTLVAWDVSLSGLDARLLSDKNAIDGWTCFGVTPTLENGTSTISDISFYSWKEAATKYPELEAVGGGADGPVPYEFVNTNWVTTDIGRLSQDQIYYDENENSISVDVEGQNNVALGNSTAFAANSGITTVGYYVTKEQNWLVVMGESLSVGEGDNYMWWLNGANYNTQVAPTITVRNEYTAVIAWDVNETGLDDNLLEEENTLNGWTAFGLTSTTGSSVIYDISFYTWDEAVAKYPELEENENLQALLNTYVADVAKVEELIDDLEGQLEEGVEDPDREDKIYDALEALYDAESDYGYEDTTLPDDAAVEELKEAIEELEAAIAAAAPLSTSVSNIVVNTRESDAIYTLSGVRVQKAVKGVYIVNGKKVLVK